MNFIFIAAFSFHSHSYQESLLIFRSIDDVLSSLEARVCPSEEMLAEETKLRKEQKGL